MERTRMKAETKVGLMFLVTVSLIVIFAYYLGALNPFSNSNELIVAYNFAGGIEVGSPVRVMGIKVGKVKSIEFAPEHKMPSGEEVKLQLRITVDKDAWKTVRKDSRFYINLAGVIGEKFLEITPGTIESENFKSGALVRGEDPPRIDQLISQSYGLAGKIIEIVENNEGSVSKTLKTMNSLVVNLNKLMRQVDKVAGKKEVQGMLRNTASLLDDTAYFSAKVRSDEGQKTIILINELIHRLKELDGKAIEEFFQKEGIKAKLF